MSYVFLFAFLSLSLSIQHVSKLPSTPFYLDYKLEKDGQTLLRIPSKPPVKMENKYWTLLERQKRSSIVKQRDDLYCLVKFFTFDILFGQNFKTLKIYDEKTYPLLLFQNMFIGITNSEGKLLKLKVIINMLLL